MAGFALCALILAGCNDDNAGSTQGSASNASSQTSQSQTSQSAPSGPGTSQLTWDAPTNNTNGTALTNLAGYTISYGTSPAALNQSVEVTDPTATSYTVTGLTSGTWYFEVAAYTSDGTQSAPSEIVSDSVT